MTDDIFKKMDDMVKKGVTYFVSSPATIAELRAKGAPIEEVFITNEEFLNRIFSETRILANDLVKIVPRLDKRVANATVSALYDDLLRAYVFGIHDHAINAAAKLLETSFKIRLHKEKLKSDPNSKWELMETIDLGGAINGLQRAGVITEDEKKELIAFNEDVRNPYTHHNLLKLIKKNGITLAELPSVNIATGEVTVQTDVDPTNYPWIWFSAKRALDRATFVTKVDYCMKWVNKVLAD